MDTVSWQSSIHLPMTAFQIAVVLGLQAAINSLWMKPSVVILNMNKLPDYLVFFCLQGKNIGAQCLTLTSGDMSPPPITFSLCRNSTLACTDKKKVHRCKAFVLIILHLWGSWWQSSHGLRMVRSQISWWVWYEPLGEEGGGGGSRGWGGGEGGHSWFPARLIGKSLLLICPTEAMLSAASRVSCAHLVSAGRVRVKLRKLVGENRVGLFSSLFVLVEIWGWVPQTHRLNASHTAQWIYISHQQRPHESHSSLHCSTIWEIKGLSSGVKP